MNNSSNLETLDALWKLRHNEDDLRDHNRLLDALARENIDLEARYEIDFRRARAHQFAAMQLLERGQTKAARAEFERGVEVSQWTLAASSNGSLGETERGEGRFWWAVNTLEMGRMGGKWAAYWAARGAKPHLETVQRWDEEFHFAGALRVLGRLAHLAPPRVGGGLETSREHFERALQIADNSTTRLYFAALLDDTGAKNEAKAQIEAILSAPDDQDWMWEQARDRQKAQQWLAQNP
ncbi:TRAP transporter T-component [Abditibacterium utsteinense]|uniref:TRAP transporter T-component n=1 Tax=Abditibacterium utsteinense TaxID=1960156 RepID=A0A2S8SNU2_9BACT|nr:TRAP transporter TatT component family protein [Abditibacterium utsteinense]PQV62461.1 TRAP transporter T-component [Abditibacterium utsteinense]